MPIYELAALGASLCFAVAGLLAMEPSRALGAIRFNRVRMLLMAVLLFVVASITGGIETLSVASMPILVTSGLVGIFLGDTFLFAGLRRVGPRRNAVMFAFNAPLTAIAGIFYLDELLSFPVFVGCVLVTTGVIVAISYGQTQSSRNHWDAIHGSLPIGLLFGFLAAAGQAGGILLSRPLMQEGIDPVAASAVRVAIAAIALIVVYELSTHRSKKDHSVWTRQIVVKTVGSGIIGMGIGMTLVMFALRGGEAGIVSTLSSAAPVLMLPIIWATSGRRPALGAWIGATIVFFGTALILIPS
jgi:drug/metabolite transporter (DMT)-like permease